jgi:orotate phosphoribosyltransferase
MNGNGDYHEGVELQTLEMLARLKAVITGSHVVYASGKHGSAYVNKDAIYPHTFETADLCELLSKMFAKDDVEVVLAPAVGGVILSQWTAYYLSNELQREVLGVYADKEGEGFVVKRGYDKLIKEKRVLIVEDILTTGGSVKKVVEIVQKLEGIIVGVGALVNRGGVTAADVGGVPKLMALANVTLDAWDESACPLCAQNVPINTDVGKGREFLAKKAGTQ